MAELFGTVFPILVSTIVFGPFVAWLFFRSRGYKRHLLDAPPGPGWERTAERSVDPRTDDLIDVWYNPSTGERAYVRAPRRG